MTLEEMLSKERKQKKKQKHNDEEHRIQCACVKYFNLKYPKLKGRLFAVPNGGRRDAVTASKLKAEGVIAGVSGLSLKPWGIALKFLFLHHENILFPND